MPSLYTDSDDDDWNFDESIDEIITNSTSNNSNVMHIRSHEEKSHHTQTHHHNHNQQQHQQRIFRANNIHFIYDNQQPTIHIGQSDLYPPNLDPSITAGACYNNNNRHNHDQFTNVQLQNDMVSNRNINYNSKKIIIIQNSCDENDPCRSANATVSALSEYVGTSLTIPV